ncbi:MAG: iron complex transport system substrate-binding protein [Puniceicoccaceae bacterium 5H]|nr:MAG: iron complex transport system substrate-binding protein [Puniceicoccaceae bacterium 5H]
MRQGFNFIAVWVLSLCAAPLASAANRLVTLGGPVTEIVYALGHGDEVIATDQSSTYPAAAAELPQVGYIRAISAEGVLAQEPDLILATDDLGPPAAAEQLAQGGVELVQIPTPRDRETLYAAIRAVAEVLGEEANAAEMIKGISQDFAEAAKIGNGHEAPRVVFLLAHFGGGRAAGRGTMGDGMLQLAGGQNVFGDFEGYKQVSEEAVLQENPDFVLVGVMPGMEDASRDRLLATVNLPTLAELPVEVVPLEISYYLSFGPRAGKAARDMAEMLYETSDTE